MVSREGGINKYTKFEKLKKNVLMFLGLLSQFKASNVSVAVSGVFLNGGQSIFWLKKVWRGPLMPEYMCISFCDLLVLIWK